MNSRGGGSIGIALVLIISAIAGTFTLFTTNVTGVTYVSGIVYDGAGGPWNISGSPYVVTGDVIVPQGQTLTIEPGVDVRFDGYFNLFVDGNLSAVGSSTSMINVTSNSAMPLPWDWSSIRINATGHADIRYCNITFGEIGIHLFGSSNNTIINNGIHANLFGGIHVESSSNNTISGNNVSNNFAGIEVYQSSNNNTITYNNFYFIELDSIYLYSSDHNNVSGNNVSVTDGDSISLYSSSHNNVTYNNISTVKFDGIYLRDSSNNTIKGNNASFVEESGIHLHSSTHNLVLENDVIMNDENGIYLELSSNNNVTDNRIKANVGNGIYLRSSDNGNMILRNNITGNSAGISFEYSSNNTLEHNDIMSNDWDGIDLRASSFNLIVGNNVSKNNYNGIWPMISSDYNTVSENNLTSNGRNGLSFLGSSNNTISNNLLSRNDLNGIDLLGCYNNTIKGNHFSNNIDDGISVMWSQYNVITENNVTLNNDSGISLWDSSNNTMTGNNVSFNDVGFNLTASSSNWIYHNIIIGNTNQSFDFTADNIWNDTYPSGGNYWSDWTTPDLKSGPTQTHAGSDGIVDLPYEIDADSMDFYPFTNATGFEAPGPPTNLNARLDGTSQEHVIITWNLSVDDPADVMNYAIYYNKSSWTKHFSNPVLDMGLSGPDMAGVYAPSVIEDNDTYRMWFSCNDGTYHTVCHANSTDGLSWSKYPFNPVLPTGFPTSWDGLHANHPSVIKDDGVYRMWYSGYNNTNYRIGLAESSDGIVWEKNESNPVLDIGPPGSWDVIRVWAPSVIKDGGVYKMWYSGMGSSFITRIGFATSPDGINWTKYDDPATTSPLYAESDPVLNIGMSWEGSFVGYPYVIKNENVFELWYTGCNVATCGIGHAVSTDGITWTKSAINPVLISGPPGAWDDSRVAEVSVLHNDGTYEMWFSGDEGLNTLRIGYAIRSEMPYNRYGIGYEFLASVPAGTNYYVHQDAGIGDPHNYFYYVQANKTDALSNSRSADQVAKYSKGYEPGKNLVSVPLIVNNTEISYVLQALKFDSAWSYNSTDVLDPWKSYNPLKPINDLTTIDHKTALWVVVTESSNLVVAGIVPRVTDIQLKTGWNLVSYPSFIKRDVSYALGGIPYARIEGYVDVPPDYLKILNGDDLMESGFGYWIKVVSDATWSIRN